MTGDDDNPIAGGPSESETPPVSPLEEPAVEAPADEEVDGRTGRLYRFTRKLLDRRELGEDAKVLLGTVLETTDHAKTEAVRLIAREVRNYLDELQLKEDLAHLLTSHSLKVSAEFTLVPHEPQAASEPPSAPKATEAKSGAKPENKKE